MEARPVETVGLTAIETAYAEPTKRPARRAASLVGRALRRALLAVVMLSALAMTLFWAGLAPSH
jgi:hypothetical protein